jgi:hypothetical protein
MMGDVAEKVLRLRDALETVESINNQLDELRKIFIVVLTVAVATLGIASILWDVWGITYPQLYTMWVIVITALIFFPLVYAAHRLDKAAEIKGLYQDWDDKLKEGELGVLAILESLDWDYVEYRVNRAKTLYPILLIIDEALWIAAPADLRSACLRVSQQPPISHNRQLGADRFSGFGGGHSPGQNLGRGGRQIQDPVEPRLVALGD